MWSNWTTPQKVAAGAVAVVVGVGAGYGIYRWVKGTPKPEDAAKADTKTPPVVTLSDLLKAQNTSNEYLAKIAGAPMPPLQVAATLQTAPAAAPAPVAAPQQPVAVAPAK